MDWISDPSAWGALAALVALEIVLGVDNIVFISILSSKLPEHDQARARRTGLVAAGASRILFLLSVGIILRLEDELFAVGSKGFSGKELILMAGGVFLIFKATREIHHKLEGAEGDGATKAAPSFAAVIGQVMLLDIVFSIDSVVTAVGMTPHVAVMVIAIVVSVLVMLWASTGVYRFVNGHPTVKMLALAFLLLIGTTLIAEGFGEHIPKGYVYTAMLFSVFVETLNIRAGRKLHVEPVHLHSKLSGNGR